MSPYEKRKPKTMIGELVDQLKEKCGMQKSHVARRIKRSPVTLSLYISGKRAMPDDTLGLFLDLLRENQIKASARAIREADGLPNPPHRPKRLRQDEADVEAPRPLAAVGAPPFDVIPLFDVPIYAYAPMGPMTDEALIEEDEPLQVAKENTRYEHIRLKGRSLEPHIKSGTIARVDRKRAQAGGAQHGELVIFVLDGELGCGYLQLKGRRPVKVLKTSPDHKDITIRSGQTFAVQAIVIKTVVEEDVPRLES